MDEKTPNKNPSAPLLVSDHDLEQNFEKKLSDVNSLITSNFINK